MSNGNNTIENEDEEEKEEEEELYKISSLTFGQRRGDLKKNALAAC